MTQLTEEVLRYQQTGEGLARLINQISVLVYRFPRSQPGFTEEDGAEFLLRFIPRITRLIERYHHNGSFESYLATTLRWQVKTFAAERASVQLRHTTLELSGVLPVAETVDPEQSYFEAREAEGNYHPGADARQTPLSSGQANRLLFVSLKMAERLDERDYRRVARAVGCDPEWLLGCWHRLRDECSAQRERRRIYQIRRNRAWFRMRCLQYRLDQVTEEDTRQRLLRDLRGWKHRYEQVRRVLRKMQDGPSHEQIANVLEIPKGTVDSGVFYAKREFTRDSYQMRLALALTNA